jgi:adenosylcobinamide-GDP ribazoletransferase
MLRLILVAIEQLTILPIRLLQKAKDNEIYQAIKYFPFIGILLGACLVVIEYIFSFYFPTPITAIILILFMIIITGGRYIEDFAYTVNLIFSKRAKRTDASFSVLANPVGSSIVFLFILIKFSALAEFVAGKDYCMLLFFPMMGRIAIVTACWMFPNIIPESAGKVKLETRDFIIAGIASLLLGFGFVGFKAVFVFGSIILIIVFIIKNVLQKIPEAEKNILGFLNELAELVALLIGTVVI